MSEAIHDTQNDFWRPPLVAPSVPIIVPGDVATLVEACGRCESEFMVGARFCYVCGTVRPTQTASGFTYGWTRYLEFNHINQALGLPVASLIAFVAGLGCLLAAALVGAIYAVQNAADFQAVQFLANAVVMAAVAFFVAGILLLKRSDTPACRQNPPVPLVRSSIQFLRRNR